MRNLILKSGETLIDVISSPPLLFFSENTYPTNEGVGGIFEEVK